MSFQCEIMIKNPTNVFYVGKSLRGYVRLVVREALMIRSIQVKMCGKAVVKWQMKRAICQCEENCLNQQMNVLGKRHLKTTKKISNSKHKINN